MKDCQSEPKCSLCCKLQTVAAVRSPGYSWCQHARNGCAIYEMRPDVCQSYECIWLQAAKAGKPMPDDLKPVVCGAIFEPTTTDNGLVVIVNDGVDWRTGALGQAIKHMSESFTMLVRERTTVKAVKKNRVVGIYRQLPLDNFTDTSIHIEMDELQPHQQYEAVP